MTHETSPEIQSSFDGDIPPAAEERLQKRRDAFRGEIEETIEMGQPRYDMEQRTEVHFASNAKPEQIETFIRNHPNLEDITLNDVSELTPESIALLAERPLRSLTVYKTPLSPDDLRTLSRAPVESLSLIGEFVTDEHIDAISSFAPLKSLKINSAPNVTSEGIRMLADLDFSAMQILNLSSLENFHSSYFRDMRADQLRDLSISGNGVGSDVSVFGHLPIEKLHVSRMAQGSDIPRGFGVDDGNFLPLIHSEEDDGRGLFPELKQVYGDFGFDESNAYLQERQEKRQEAEAAGS